MSLIQDIGLVVVASPPDAVEAISYVCDLYPNLPILVVPGAESRQASVQRALAVVPPEIEVVLVHDAARAFAPPALFERVVAAVRNQCDAIVPTLPVSDTIKEVDAKNAVEATLQRDRLRAVQTPQGFTREVLQAAHRAASGKDVATDDAGLVERIGRRVEVIDGDPEAFKVTTPFDILIAEAILRSGSRRGR